MESQKSSVVYVNNSIGIPNFLSFIEADVRTVFGQKGFFIVLNILNLGIINKEYGSDI